MTSKHNAGGSVCFILTQTKYLIAGMISFHQFYCNSVLFKVPTSGMRPFGGEGRGDIIGPGQPPTSRLGWIVIFAS